MLLLILALCLAVALPLGLWALIEPRLLQVEYRILHTRASYSLRSWADQQDTALHPDLHLGAKLSSDAFKKPDRPGLRLLFFSDLHADPFSLRTEQVLRTLEPLLPHIDLCLFGGDLSNGRRGRSKGIALLQAIQSRCQIHQIPCYAVSGNHDHSLTLSDWKQTGFCLLRNQSAFLTCPAGQVQLSGLGDLRTDIPICPARTSDSALQLHLVLGHNPDLIHLLSPDVVDAFLCGHFHGGQIRLPFHLEFRLLRPERLAHLGLRSGSFLYRRIPGYVSRGVGCVLFPLRLGARPECSALFLPFPKQEEIPQS